MPPREASATGSRGSSLMEMIVVLAILSLLASMAMPYAKKSYQREKELELREALRTVRTAIDKFHDDWERTHRKKGAGAAGTAPAGAPASAPASSFGGGSSSYGSASSAAPANAPNDNQASTEAPASAAGYPLDLQELTQGIPKPGGQAGEIKHYMRALPVNPFALPGTPLEEQWTFVTSQRTTDQITTSSYGKTLSETEKKETDIYDLHAKTPQIALDGTRYEDW